MATSNPGVVGKAPHMGAIVKGGFIIVEIGLQRQQYHLHKALVAHHSEYFRKALNGPWKEAEDKTVFLEDIDPMVLEIFSQWLYTQKLPTKDEWDDLATTYQPAIQNDKEGSNATPKPVFNKYIILTKALIFAERFFSPGFRRAANNSIVNMLHIETKAPDVPFVQAAKYAFEVLPEDHAIIKLFTDVYCRPAPHVKKMNPELKQWLEDFMPPKYLVRLMAKAYEITSSEVSRYGHSGHFNTCTYHEHADSSERSACKGR